MRVTVKYDNPSKGRAGECIYGLFGCTIIIDPNYATDKGLMAHERFHARGNLVQMWARSFMCYWFDEYRYAEELAAYAIQYKAYNYSNGYQAGKETII